MKEYVKIAVVAALTVTVLSHITATRNVMLNATGPNLNA